MSLFYKPQDGWAADVIPFFWQGEYHLFYLKDYRNRAERGEGTPWWHLGTRDFVSFTDYGEALPRGTAQDQDLYVFTGSVTASPDNRFHIYEKAGFRCIEREPHHSFGHDLVGENWELEL